MVRLEGEEGGRMNRRSEKDQLKNMRKIESLHAFGGGALLASSSA